MHQSKPRHTTSIEFVGGALDGEVREFDRKPNVGHRYYVPQFHAEPIIYEFDGQKFVLWAKAYGFPND